MLQWLELFILPLHGCLVDILFLSSYFQFLFPSFKSSWCYFFFKPLKYHLFWARWFLDNVCIHMAHTLSLAWKESLVFVDGYIDPTYTQGLHLGSWERYPII